MHVGRDSRRDYAVPRSKGSYPQHCRSTPDHTTLNRYDRFNVRVTVTIDLIRIVKRIQAGGGTALKRDRNSFNGNNGGRNEESDFYKIPRNNMDRDWQISRLVLKTGTAESTIVVVVSVFVVMEGHYEGGKYY